MQLGNRDLLRYFHSLNLISEIYRLFALAYKSALVQSATVAATSSDIFGEEVFELDRIALSLLQSSVSAVTQGTTKQSSPQVSGVAVLL